jgi:hypothetical protein
MIARLRYYAAMKSPVPPFNLRLPNPCVRIETAYDCDGSICHQPIFNEEGGLNYVAPHYHLIEWDADISRPRCYYALFGDLLETRHKQKI